MAQGHEIMTVNSCNGGQITGWGIALGNDLVTNHDLASRMDTSDEWIKERTGISERRIGGTTAGLAVQAAKDALEVAGCSPEEIDLLVLATTTLMTKFQQHPLWFNTFLVLSVAQWT